MRRHPGGPRRLLRRSPPHAPGGEGPQAGVAGQHPAEPRGHRPIDLGKRRGGRVVPRLEAVGGPRQGLVEVAQVAGVGPARPRRLGRRRAADGVRAYRLQQPVARVGHVAVVAPAARRLRGVPGVRGRVGAERLVALQARLVAVHARRHLVGVGPRRDAPRVVGRLVHGVAREAAQRALRRVRVPEAGRVEQPVVLAARDPDEAVGPERPADEPGVGGDQGPDAGRGPVRRGLDDEAGVPQLVAGAVRQSFPAGPPLVRGVVVLPHAVALPAHLRRPPGVEVRGLDDGRVAGAGDVESVAAQRVAVGLDVGLRGAVARLAGDAELGRRRVDGLLGEGDGAVGGVEPGPPLRGVAHDAHRVPVPVEHRERLPRRVQHEGAARHPPPLGEKVGAGQDVQAAVVPGGVPVDVLVVRPGHQDHLPPDAGAFVVRSLPAGVVELRPQLVSPAVEAHRAAVDRVDPHAIEVGADGVGRGDLGHRPVIRPVPRRVLGRVARPARIRRHVAAAGHLDRSIDDLRFRDRAAGGDGQPDPQAGRGDEDQDRRERAERGWVVRPELSGAGRGHGHRRGSRAGGSKHVRTARADRFRPARALRACGRAFPRRDTPRGQPGWLFV